MKRIVELEVALKRLLKAIEDYQRHGDMMGEKYKNALLVAKIEAMEALA